MSTLRKNVFRTDAPGTWHHDDAATVAPPIDRPKTIDGSIPLDSLGRPDPEKYFSDLNIPPSCNGDRGRFRNLARDIKGAIVQGSLLIVEKTKWREAYKTDALDVEDAKRNYQERVSRMYEDSQLSDSASATAAEYRPVSSAGARERYLARMGKRYDGGK